MLANEALSIACVRAQIEALSCEWMAFAAMCLLRVLGSRTYPAQSIGLWRDRFQVSRVTATDYAAEMVEMQPLRYRPFD